MKMQIVNGVASLLLAVATALLALFYLGTQAQHDQAMARYFWQELNLRFIFCSVVGLVGAALWWGVNGLLRKAGLAKEINLRQTAYLLAASVVSGSLVGSLLCCLSYKAAREEHGGRKTPTGFRAEFRSVGRTRTLRNPTF